MFLAENQIEAVADAAHFGGKTTLYRTHVIPPNYAAASGNIAWDKMG